MINKFYKIIHNRYSRFLKFIFFLRYLFVIFFISIVLFLLIPQFFDYKKKEEIIKLYLLKNYGIAINQLEKISFNSFPVPYLQIENIESNLYSKSTNLKIGKLIIYPKLFSIYNFNNFHSRKIQLENNFVKTDLKNTKSLFKNIFRLEKKISFKNLNLQIEDTSGNIINLRETNFLNYGYKKNVIMGEIFDRGFEIKIKDDLTNINFKLLKTGVSATLIFSKNNLDSQLNGLLKGEILKSNFKLNFDYDQNSLKINNFIFREKNLSFNSDGVLIFNPFFKINLNSEIKNINSKIFRDLDLEKILKFKELIKKFNSKNNIFFESKKFSNNFLDDLNVKTELIYGRLNYIKNFTISDSMFSCRGNINLLEEYPVLYFNCNINSSDIKKLLKKFNIDYKNKNEVIDIILQGNLNIFNNRINFDLIEINENYKATKDDLKFYKTSFESILFDENFLSIFKISKLKRFILEIS